MKILTESFGSLPDGRDVLRYTLENNYGMRVSVTDWGATILSVQVPDREGKTADVVLGHPDLAAYQKNLGYLGALVGRSANRIRGAMVTLEGLEYPLEANNGGNNLHSASGGLSFRLFRAEARTVDNQPMLLLSHTVEDRSDGFPGNLTVNVAYLLTDDNTLTIDYRAVSDRETVINLTNHSYFNLGGHDSGTVDGHRLKLRSGFYCPNGADGIPTGEIRSVAGTAFFLDGVAPLGEHLASVEEQVKQFGGFDHSVLLDGDSSLPVAELCHPASGRVMEVFTDRPAMQVYSANKLVCVGKEGARYGAHHGICFETQFVPNAMETPWLRSPVHRAGEEFHSATSFRFSHRK